MSPQVTLSDAGLFPNANGDDDFDALLAELDIPGDPETTASATHPFAEEDLLSPSAPCTLLSPTPAMQHHHSQPAASWSSLAVEVTPHIERQVVAQLKAIASVYNHVDLASIPPNVARTHAAGVLHLAHCILCDGATTVYPLADYDPVDVRVAACLRACRTDVTVAFLAAKVMTGIAGADMALRAGATQSDRRDTEDTRRMTMAMLLRVAAALDFTVDILSSGGPHHVERLQATTEIYRRGSELIQYALASLRAGGSALPVIPGHELPEAPLRSFIEALAADN